jgi:outer membrane lipoprotein-sorting protein
MSNIQRLTSNAFLVFALAIGYGLSALGLAQNVADIGKQVQDNLSKSPWEANVTGKIQLPDGSAQDADFHLQVIPSPTPAGALVRIDFKKPSSLEGNFVVISDKEVWNYLFLTNQVVIQPRAKAKVEGLGVNLTGLSDFNQLTEKVNLKLLGDAQTSEGAAWRISGAPKDASSGFASMEILVLKSDPRPVAISLKDSAGKTVADLAISGFKRAALTAAALKKYPGDAEVVKK